MEYNNLIDKYLEKYGNPETERFVDLSLDFVDEMHSILEEKGISQKDLAKRMNKSAAEVSKWLSGNHNMTFKSIAKLSVALNEDIILTTKKAKKLFTGCETNVINLGVQHSLNKNCAHNHWSFDFSSTEPSITTIDCKKTARLAYGW